jgi:hypothetical protein
MTRPYIAFSVPHQITPLFVYLTAHVGSIFVHTMPTSFSSDPPAAPSLGTTIFIRGTSVYTLHLAVSMCLGTSYLTSPFFPSPNSSPQLEHTIYMMFFSSQAQSHGQVQIYRLIMFILMHVYYLLPYGLLSCYSRIESGRHLQQCILAPILVLLLLLVRLWLPVQHGLMLVLPPWLLLAGRPVRSLLWLLCHHVAVHYRRQLPQPLQDSSTAPTPDRSEDLARPST